MRNMNFERIFTYIGIAAIILLLFGLGGWYIFLNQSRSAIEGESTARGFAIGIPSFVGSRGSTAANTSPENTNSANSAFARLLGVGQPALNDATTIQSNATREETRAPRFWRVTATPVAGAAFLATSSILRYVERGSGHVFEADPFTGSVTRISNTLTPRVYEASLGGGTSVILRTIEKGAPVTFGGTATTTTPNGISELELTNLGSAIEDIVSFANTPEILMIADAGASSHLIRSHVDGSTPKQLLSLPGGDFKIQLAGENIVLTERAGSGILGNAYRVASSLIPLVKNVPGLITRVQAQSENVLYSSDDGTRLRLFTNTTNANQKEISLATIAEKCAWAPQGTVAYCAGPQGTIPTMFLDRWYRGEIHTEDVWYKIDTASAKVDTLFRVDSSYVIDVENPTVDPTGKYILFQNARDKSLWVLRITE